jgi:hypothetical protein
MVVVVIRLTVDTGNVVTIPIWLFAIIETLHSNTVMVIPKMTGPVLS